MPQQVENFSIGSELELRVARRRNFSFVDFNNGFSPILAIQMVTSGPTKHDSVQVEIRLTFLDEDFADPLVLSFEEVSTDSKPVSVRDFRLRSVKFYEIQDVISGTLSFTVIHNGQILGSAEVQVNLSPMQEWLWETQSLETLASFSIPRDPAVAEILQLTSELVAKKREMDTQSPFRGAGILADQLFSESLPFEVSAYAVRQEIQSLFEAIQGLGLHYSNPPAAYTELSQRIRLPREILTEKAATCLDTSLLFTACLEEMGYSPLLAMSPGHAFAGVWVAPVAQDPRPIMEMADAQAFFTPLMLFVETTDLCGQTSFDEAVMHAQLKVEAALAPNVASPEKYKFLSLRSIKNGGTIKPLPRLEKQPDGTVAIVETQVVTVAAVSRSGPNDNPAARQQIDASPQRVRTWKESLLDLTFRNPLLEMSRKNGDLKKGGMRILPPSSGPGAIEDELQRRDNSGRPHALPIQMGVTNGHSILGQSVDLELQKAIDAAFQSSHGLVVSGNLDAAKLLSKLKTLARTARTAIAETGINSLYITFGSLTWKRAIAKGQPGPETATSPLLLLPITLEPVRGGFVIRLDESDSMATNETLAIKLLDQYEIDIPKLRTPDLDDSGFDVRGLIDNVRAKIIEKGYTDWRVDEDCTIGFFDFSTYHQWKDLNDNWSSLSDSPLVKHLIEKPGQSFEDPAHSEEQIDYDLDEEASKVPVETDGSQIEAIVKSLRGESFVIQGPPGTGKSQTITNLLARNMQEGRRVLFVCAKEAALEVVKNRLDEIGLGDFVLDLHGSKTKPAVLRARLTRALDIVTNPDNTGLENAKYEYDSALGRLRQYPQLLHTVDEDFGVSLYQARDKYLVGRTEAELPLNRALLASMRKEGRQAFATQLLQIGTVGQNAGTTRTNEWSLSRLPSDRVTREVKQQVAELVAKIKAGLALAQDDAAGREILSSVSGLDDLSAIGSFGGEGLATGAIVTLALDPALPLQLSRAQEAVVKFKNSTQNAIACPGVMTAPLAQLDALALEVVNANLFNRSKRLESLTYVLKRHINPLFAVTKDNYQAAIGSLRDLHAAGQTLLAEVRSIVALGISADWNPFEPGQLESFEVAAANLMRVRDFIVALSDETRAPIQRLLESDRGDVLAALRSFAEDFTALVTLLNADKHSIDLWRGNQKLIEAISENIGKWVSGSSEGDLRKLSLWGELVSLLMPLSEAKQTDAVDAILTGKVGFDDVAAAFDRAYWRLVFDKLVDDRNLGNFEGAILDRAVTTFAGASNRLREFNREVMADQILSNRTFDGKAGVGKAGELRATLQKTKGGLSVRNLLKKYWSTITEITPVIAASPDSVAKFMDVSWAKFDIVVFDEASQITVASAIGALGRAKSAIVVGDSKQMPPTALFTAGSGSNVEDEFEEDLEDTFARDEESILSEAVKSQIPFTRLSWHYRSQDELLIAFSNKEYYDGGLNSFPSPTERRNGFGVKHVLVSDGRFFRSGAKAALKESASQLSGQEKKIVENLASADLIQTNPIEAMAIVKEVESRFKDPVLSQQSIGIVTMNEQQKKLIAALLEDSKTPGVSEALKPSSGDYLFVRALEKVQGDERDVILMSMGFSKDASGTVPLQFGPMTKAGSERRWNVAITRARAQVVVFSSFEAKDLALSETSSEGMKHLKAYLEMAQKGPDSIGLRNGVAVRTSTDRHRDDIRAALESRGWNVQSNVGLSGFRIDLGVANANNPTSKLLGILLDGEGWNARKTASDRDVLPAVVLEHKMGWPRIERIWLPAWIRDREAELNRIDTLLKDIEKDQSSAKSMAAPSKSVGPSRTTNDGTDENGVESDPVLTAKSAGSSAARGTVAVNIDFATEFSEYLPGLIGEPSHLNNLADPDVRAAIIEIADSMTIHEGPVSPARFARTVAKGFGLTSVKSEKAAAINSIPPTAKYARDGEGFVFPEGVKPNDYRDWRRQETAEGRELADISLIEIANVMRDLCQLTHGMNEADLFRQTYMALGRTKLGAVAAARMAEALKVGYKAGLLDEDEDLVIALS